jgi:hypothetical protein
MWLLLIVCGLLLPLILGVYLMVVAKGLGTLAEGIAWLCKHDLRSAEQRSADEKRIAEGKRMPVAEARKRWLSRRPK